MTTPSAETPAHDSTVVPWSDFVRFVRQLSHDLRNHLNAAELQAAYLGELAPDEEIKTEIKRLRQMMSELSSVLQKLSANVVLPKPSVISYGAAEFIEDIRRKLANVFPKEQSEVEWDVQLPACKLGIDPQLVQEAMLELFRNAFQHRVPGRSLMARARIDGESFLFVLDEPKKDFDLSLENWGREPLRRTTQGHYGLGLSRVRAIVESHGGHLDAHYDETSATLSTTIKLPLMTT